MSFTPPPAPSLNGGLYTGEPFRKGAPWANVPVIPDAGVIAFTNLPASSPYEARYMLPGGGLRPGNNTPLMPDAFHRSYRSDINSMCIPSGPKQKPGKECAADAGSAATRSTWIL
jgi:hypothetical protein